MADLEQAKRDYFAREAEVFRGPGGRLVNVSAQRARIDALLEAAGVHHAAEKRRADEAEALLAAKVAELNATRALVEEKESEIVALREGGATPDGGLR